MYLYPTNKRKSSEKRHYQKRIVAGERSLAMQQWRATLAHCGKIVSYSMFNALGSRPTTFEYLNDAVKELYILHSNRLECLLGC